MTERRRSILGSDPDTLAPAIRHPSLLTHAKHPEAISIQASIWLIADVVLGVLTDKSATTGPLTEQQQQSISQAVANGAG